MTSSGGSASRTGSQLVSRPRLLFTGTDAITITLDLTDAKTIQLMLSMLPASLNPQSTFKPVSSMSRLDNLLSLHLGDYMKQDDDNNNGRDANLTD